MTFCSSWKASSSTAPEVFCSTRSTLNEPPMMTAVAVFFSRFASFAVYSALMARTPAVAGVLSWV